MGRKSQYSSIALSGDAHLVQSDPYPVHTAPSVDGMTGSDMGLQAHIQNADSSDASVSTYPVCDTNRRFLNFALT